MKLIITKNEKNFIEETLEMGKDNGKSLPNNKIVKINEDSDSYVIDINTQFIFDMVKLAAKYSNILKPIGAMMKSINSDLKDDFKKLGSKWGVEKKTDAAVEEVLFPGDKIEISVDDVNTTKVSLFYIGNFVFHVSPTEITYNELKPKYKTFTLTCADATKYSIEKALRESKIISKSATITWDDAVM